MTAWQKRSYEVGCGLWVLTGLHHMLGRFRGWRPPANDEEETLFALFQGYDIDVGGLGRTLAELFDGLSLSFAALLVLLGFLGLMWRRAPGVPAGILRRVAGMNAVGALALLLLGLPRLPIPPLVGFAAAGIAFSLATLRPRPQPGGAGPA